ncbi:MAG: hypothetical protein ABSE49_25005 [Polyangiaceae bacterium]|jgi:hypothetical protein
MTAFLALARVTTNQALRAGRLVVFAGVALSSTPSRADVTDPPGPALRLPVPEAQRPLTLPRFVLAPQAGFQADQRPDEGTFIGLDLSGAFGVTDDVTVHALVAPLQLSTPPGYGGFQYGETNRNFGPGAGVTLRLLRGPVELAADLSGHVFTIPYLSGGSVTPSVLLRVHATDWVRLDVAPAVTFQFATETTTASTTVIGGMAAPPSTSVSSANAVRVSVPVTLLGNLTRSFDLGLTSGLTIYDTSDARDSTGIPAGIVLGYAVAGPHGPVLDVDPFFDFPYLVMPGRATVTNTQQYQVGLNVTGYLYL